MATNPDEYTGISSPADSDGHRKVNTLTESEVWETGIYQIEKNDLLTGGEKGLANLQAQQLANRTGYLKGKLEQADQKINDSIKKSARIKNLENMVMELYAAREIESKAPSGSSGVMVENFSNGAQEIDRTTADITSIAEDFSSVNVSDASELVIGRCYQFVDNNHSEEIRINDIDKSSGLNHVIFESPLKNQGITKSAKLCRTTTPIGNGTAYSGNSATAVTGKDMGTFSGSGSVVPMHVTIDFSDLSKFTQSGAETTKEGKLFYDLDGYGTVLVSSGQYSGVWKNIDNAGNDLLEVLDEQEKTLPLPESYAIVLDEAGAKGGIWKRIDKDGEALEL